MTLKPTLHWHTETTKAYTKMRPLAWSTLYSIPSSCPSFFCSHPTWRTTASITGSGSPTALVKAIMQQQKGR